MRNGKFLGLAIFALSLTCVAEESLSVSKFGAIPNDGKCDIQAIAECLKYAKENGAKKIIFESGVYDLEVKDVNNDRAILINGFTGLVLEGAVNEKGEPSTVLQRRYEYKGNLNATQILRVEYCPEFTLKNIVFDNSPQYMSAGEIVEKTDDYIIVKVFEGNPYIDNTVLYCANLWDKNTRNLLKVGSVTFGGPSQDGEIEKNIPEYTLSFHGDAKDRLLKLPSPKVAKKCNVGEVLSWNFGWLGYQTYFNYCDNLRLENVWTHSTIGFGMQASHCKNVTAKGVKFLRKGNQMHVGARDGWKLMACLGTAVIDDMYVEGVRWDGQNVHGMFAWPFEILDKKTALFSNDLYGLSADCFPVGSKVGFCDGRKDEVLLTVASRETSTQKTQKGKRMIKVSFVEDLPAFTKESTTCNLYGMNIDSYTLKNSHFKNIAGTASLIRNDNVLIENCTFDNIMYPAICIGGAMDEVEGVVCKNAVVKNNTFINCTWATRHSGKGAVSVKLQNTKRVPVSENPYIKNIKILDNKFVGCNVAIHADGVMGLEVSGNSAKGSTTFIMHSDNLDEKILNNSEK